MHGDLHAARPTGQLGEGLERLERAPQAMTCFHGEERRMDPCLAAASKFGTPEMPCTLYHSTRNKLVHHLHLPP